MYMVKSNTNRQHTFNHVQHIEITGYEALLLTAGSRGRKKFRINKEDDTSFACL